MSSSSYSQHAKNESDMSNRSSVKSAEIENYSKVKKKKSVIKKQKYKEIYQPPLHFDFNLISSSSRQKEALSISAEKINAHKPKSVYNSSVASKKNDSISEASAKSRINPEGSNNNNNNSTIVHLPPPSKPNFIRKNQDTLIQANFDDRWQLFLEMKSLNDARNRIYFKVYFYKWKMLSSTKFIQRIREKTASFGSFETQEKIIQSNENKDKNKDDAKELINKARQKYNEYTSFLSEFEGQVSNFLQIPNQISNSNNKINDNINQIRSISKNNINGNQNNINNDSYVNENSFPNNNNSSIKQQNNSNSKAFISSKNENENEDNSSAFFNDFDNNSMLVENRLINEANQNTFNSSRRKNSLKNQQDSQLCEFDFTDSSDNLLQIETPPPSNQNSFMEPRPPSENSESGEIPRSEVQISTESITVANSFCDMVDNSIIKSKELAVKTKMVLDDESQSSSDVENEIKDHSFVHEKKRRYISSSSSEEEDEFLPRLMIRYAKNLDSSYSLADSFHVSRSSFDNNIDGKNKYFSRGFPSDLYDEVLRPFPVTKIKTTKNEK